MFEFLKKNALYFEKKAEEAYEDGEFGFTLFFAEQSIQLYIKYILAKRAGDYPKTHSFSVLFSALNSVMEGSLRFYEENSEIFELLEDAYLTVRYFGKEYSRSSAQKAVKILKKLKEEFRDELL